MKISLEKRLSIYEQILSIIEEYNVQICPLLYKECISLFPEQVDCLDVKKVLKLFPEFAKQKPPHVHKNERWWSTKPPGHLPRLAALYKAISLTKLKMSLNPYYLTKKLLYGKKSSVLS